MLRDLWFVKKICLNMSCKLEINIWYPPSVTHMRYADIHFLVYELNNFRMALTLPSKIVYELKCKFLQNIWQVLDKILDNNSYKQKL